MGKGEGGRLRSERERGVETGEGSDKLAGNRGCL